MTESVLLALAPNPERRETLLLRSGEMQGAWDAHLSGMVARQECSTMTREAYRKALRRLWQWAEAQAGEMVAVDAEALNAWKADLLKSVKPASANLYLAGVRAFYAWASAAGLVRANHAAALKSVKRVGIRQRHSRGWLTELEAVRLLELEDIDARDHALLSLMLFTGARGIELLRADLSDLRCEGSSCLLYVQGKGRSTSDKEPLVLTPAAAQALNAWLRERGNAPGPLFISHSRRSSGKRLAPSSLRQIVRAALQQAGITRQGISTHSLRHTAATTLLRHGGSIREAQALLRHSSIETTMVYAHEVDRLTNPPERWIHYGGVMR